MRTFPKRLKLARLLPIKKPGKPSWEKNSFRPIANVNTVKKVVEEFLKKQVTAYLEEHNIIPEEHHGGRPLHSTVTAKSILDAETHKLLENKRNVVTITTDLTMAYDLVDHKIMTAKLKKIGF